MSLSGGNKLVVLVGSSLVGLRVVAFEEVSCVMVLKHIIFCDKEYLLYYWCSGLCRDSGPADDYLLALLCT